MVVKVACSKPLSVVRVVRTLCNVKHIDCLTLNSIVDYAKRISWHYTNKQTKDEQEAMNAI